MSQAWQGEEDGLPTDVASTGCPVQCCGARLVPDHWETPGGREGERSLV